MLEKPFTGTTEAEAQKKIDEWKKTVPRIHIHNIVGSMDAQSATLTHTPAPKPASQPRQFTLTVTYEIKD